MIWGITMNDNNYPAMIFRPVDFVFDELMYKSMSKRNLIVKMKNLIEKYPQRRSFWFREFISGKHLTPRKAMVIIANNLDCLKIISKDFLINSYDNYVENAKSGVYRYDKKLKCLVKKA